MKSLWRCIWFKRQRNKEEAGRRWKTEKMRDAIIKTPVSPVSTNHCFLLYLPQLLQDASAADVAGVNEER